MKRPFIFLLSLILYLSLCAVSSAEKEIGSMSYVCRDLTGRERWQADTWITSLRPGVYLMVEKAEGAYSSFDGRISWVAAMEFERAGDGVRPLKLEKLVFDEKGETIRVERQDFDLAGNTGTCTHIEPAGKVSRTKKFRFSRDVVNRLSLGLYIQRFLESGKTSQKLQMVSEEPGLYNIELKCLGKETIYVNGREKTAYKLSIDPELGFFDFVKIFLPGAYAWHSDQPDYEWLRYAGLEGGIKSAKVEVTLSALSER